MQSQIDLIQKLNISPPKVIKFCKYFNGIFNGIFAYWVAQMVKYLPAIWRLGFDPWVGKTPRKRTWQPTPVFLPGKFYGQKSLAGYSPWEHKVSDPTVRSTTRLYTCDSHKVSSFLKYLRESDIFSQQNSLALEKQVDVINTQ